MNEPLLRQIAEFLEKQDLLAKRLQHAPVYEYGFSAVHMADAIGGMERPNVTALAGRMHITKGAVSKLVRRLAADGLVEAYTIPPNQQKVYYRLTPAGEALRAEHQRTHRLWMERDDQFLGRFSPAELAVISRFLTEFNQYLQEQLDASERS